MSCKYGSMRSKRVGSVRAASDSDGVGVYWMLLEEDGEDIVPSSIAQQIRVLFSVDAFPVE